MSLEAGLYAHLIGHPGVSQITGSRVYPEKIPQNAEMPALAYRLISTVDDEAHDRDPGLVAARFQLDVLAARAAEAIALRDALRPALKGFTGLMGTVPVQAVHWLSQWSDYDEDLELYRQSMDIKIWHAVPKAR